MGGREWVTGQGRRDRKRPVIGKEKMETIVSAVESYLQTSTCGCLQAPSQGPTLNTGIFSWVIVEGSNHSCLDPTHKNFRTPQTTARVLCNHPRALVDFPSTPRLVENSYVKVLQMSQSPGHLSQGTLLHTLQGPFLRVISPPHYIRIFTLLQDPLLVQGPLLMGARGRCPFSS